MAENLRRNLWILVIPILLLAAALASSQLYNHAFDIDEMVSMRSAGVRQVEPFSFVKAWNKVSTSYPDQAHGFALLNLIWGRIFGWSEFTVRLLPFFAGLMTLAWAYRTGLTLYSPITGLLATLLLSSSVLFITFMHVARPYALVALFSLMVVWSYYRINILRRTHRRNHLEQVCFIIGGVGLCYVHYFSTLILVALALWHFLFMLRGKFWWRQFWLFILLVLFSILQLNGFLRGINLTQSAWHFTDEGMMRFNEILPWFLYVLSNGIVNVPAMLAIGLVSLLFPVCKKVGDNFQIHSGFRHSLFLPFITFSLLSLILISNEILLLLRQERIRYLMVLWPLLALLVGCLVNQKHKIQKQITIATTLVYFVFGLYANTSSELRYEFYDLLRRFPVHRAHSIVEQYSSPHDLLLLSHQLSFIYDFYLQPFPYRRYHFQTTEHNRIALSNAAQAHLRVWLLADGADGELHDEMRSDLAEGLIYCVRYVDREDLVLELYTWSAVHCPSDQPAEMRFGEDIEMAESEMELISADTLRVDLLMQSEETTAMTAYSVALHVFDVESGKKVTQGDQGLWIGRYNPVRSEIDISTLTPGEYEVRIGLYNWQTLERLEGVDLASGVTANLLPLSRFQIE